MRPAWATISASRPRARQRVEQLVLDAAPLEHVAELERLVHVHGADQHRPAFLMHFDDVVDGRFHFSFFCPENHVRVVEADERLIRRDGEDVELVNFQNSLASVMAVPVMPPASCRA